MLLKRYLTKEISYTFSGVILVVLLIAVSNKFVKLVSKLSMGEISPEILLQFLLFQIPDLLAFLLPIGLFLAILLSFGRLFADNEIPVMFACGVSWQKLLKVSMRLALVVMILTAIFTCYFSPKLALARERLLHQKGPAMLLQALIPGKFHALNNRYVFYVADKSEQGLQQIFVAKFDDEMGAAKTWQVVTALSGNALAKENGLIYLQLEKGHQYKGVPTDNEYTLVAFDEYEKLITENNFTDDLLSHRTRPTQSLWQNPTPLNLSELQWRLSIPLSALILTLIAVPLSATSPRQGRFGKFFAASILCIIYFNLLTISKRWVAQGVISPWLGVWWVHLLFLALGFFLLFRVSRR